MLQSADESAFRDHLRAVNGRETCPICDSGRWSLRVVCGGEFLGRVCSACNHVLLFDYEHPNVKALAEQILNVVNQIPDVRPVCIHFGSSSVAMDGQQIAELVYPSLQEKIDRELATELARCGIPGSGQSSIGGAG